MREINPEMVKRAREILEAKKQNRELKLTREKILEKVEEIKLRKELEEEDDFDVC